MFVPKTERIHKLSLIYPSRIREIEEVFAQRTKVYIDYANVFHWSQKLRWHIDLRRLWQLLSSFDTIQSVSWYNGTLIGDKYSEQEVRLAEKLGYRVVTKPVKIMHLPIDVSGIPTNSPTVLANFVKRPLLRLFTVQQVEALNEILRELNDNGTKHIEMRKCNFDVEIGRDMLLDFGRDKTETFVLWSGDSDFADPVLQLMKDGKRVVLFATVRRVAVELAQTKAQIFDIQKIRNFICRVSEIPQDLQTRI